MTKAAVFIGSYAESSENGLYVCEYDTESGQLQLADQVSGLQNPTFLAVDELRPVIWAIAEETDKDGNRSGWIASYAYDPSTLKLSGPTSKVRSVDASTCHIEQDHSGTCLIVSSYHKGLVGLSPVAEDGRVLAAAQVIQHTGSSILPVQDRPRAHSAFFDPSNRYVVVSDLGADKLVVYKLDASGFRLDRTSEVATAPGAGPRHLAFHPEKPYAYGINELNSTVSVYRFDASEGVLTELQTISTLPEGFSGANSCADIHLSPDGRFVYGSNRGHDSIVVYAVSESDGTLQLVEHVSTQGGHPRNFGISPDGRFVLVANRDGNNVVTFARDSDSGRLQKTGFQLSLSKPVCVKFKLLD